MSYVGRPPEYGGYEKQDITPDGSTTSFALNYTVGTESSILVSVAGVFQQPGSAYTVTGGGANVVFSTAPASGVTVFLIFLGFAYDAGALLATGTITGQSALGAQPSAADAFLIYDDSASALKKVTYTNLIPTTHGDVSGPGSSTDDALAKFDSTTGKVIQNSNATLSDAGTLTATAFAGPIAGAVTGNVAGNVTGNIDGTVGATTPSTVVATQVDITAQGDLRLQDTTGGEYVAIQAPTAVTSWTLTLPTDDGTASQFLQTDGAGVSTWATVITDTSGAWTSGTSTTGKALVMGF